MQNTVILETKDLCKYYGSGENEVRAIDHTSLQIYQGEFAAIVGKSGSGKSTLLHMLGGLDCPTKGKILIGDKDISCMKEEEVAVFRRRKIGFIFQSFNLISSLNVWENIVLPIGLDGRNVNEAFVNEICVHWVSKRRSTIFPIRFPAASSRELPLPERLRQSLISYWRTNRPEIWTQRPGMR